MEQQEREQQATMLLELAPALRPAVQAVVQFAVAGAQAVLSTGGDGDEVWAATVVNIGEALKLDLKHQGQLSAAVAVTEMVMQQAAGER